MAIEVKRESLDTKSQHTSISFVDRDGLQILAGSDKSLPVINVNHLRMHEGRAYYVYKLHPDAARLAVNETIDIAIAWPSGYDAHVAINYECGGETEVYVYENPTTSGGTAMTINRRNRVITTASQAAAVLNPTVSSVGTEFYAELITSAEGQGNRSGAGGVGHSFEFIFKPLTSYLIRLKNVNGSSQMAELRVDWYE